MAEVITNTGLRLPETYTEEEFFEAGRFLSRIEQGMQWAVGDWYNAIPWGDKQKACEAAGLNYKTARVYGATCDAFQIGDRIANCSFDHHKRLAVQALTTEQRADLLEKAGENGWTAAQLTAQRDLLLGRPPKDTPLSIDATFEKAVAALPPSASTKVKKALQEVKRDLQADFSHQVIKLANEKAKEKVREEAEKARAALERAKIREEEASAAKERADARATPLDGWMTREEYQLIVGCLHPDRAPEDRREQFSRALAIFIRMKGTVNEKAPVKIRRATGWA